jgi:Domain of unknown function (DUF4167)
MSYQDFKGMMRQGQNKRNRGRGNGGGGHQGHQGHHQGNRPRPPHRAQVFESSGPSVKIRGNAYQVFERYIALAREAASAGDRIAAENFYQHAEHYFRIMNADGNGQGGQMVPRPMTPADTEMMQPELEGNPNSQMQPHPQMQPQPQPQQPQIEPPPSDSDPPIG